MLSIQSNKVKIHFSEVIRKVEQGQGFMITKHKKAVAKLVPCDEQLSTDAVAAVSAVRQLRCLNLMQNEVDKYKQIGRR